MALIKKIKRLFKNRIGNTEKNISLMVENEKHIRISMDSRKRNDSKHTLERLLKQ